MIWIFWSLYHDHFITLYVPFFLLPSFLFFCILKFIMLLYVMCLCKLAWFLAHSGVWNINKQTNRCFPQTLFQRLSLQNNYLSLDGKGRNNQRTRRINRSDFQQLSMKTWSNRCQQTMKQPHHLIHSGARPIWWKLSDVSQILKQNWLSNF